MQKLITNSNESFSSIASALQEGGVLKWIFDGKELLLLSVVDLHAVEGLFHRCLVGLDFDRALRGLVHCAWFPSYEGEPIRGYDGLISFEIYTEEQDRLFFRQGNKITELLRQRLGKDRRFKERVSRFYSLSEAGKAVT